MKKSLKFLVIGFAFFLTFAFNAKAEETNEPSLENAYVIGTYLFTEDGGVQLDIQTIMLAAKSITGDSLEDMVIYYKPAGEDRWLDAADEFAVVNTPDGVAEEGTIEENYFTYIDLVPQEEAIEAAKKIELVSANTIKTDALDGDIYAENIKFNQAAIDITSNGNVVTINENIGMHSYENSSKATEQWYAVLLDLNIPKEYVETAAGSDYTIEAVDKDASNLGATGNQFVVWLRGSDEDTSRVITFVDNRTDEAVAVTFNFNGIAYTEYAADAEITVNTEGVTYTDGQFNYTSGTTAIEYTENGVSKKLVLDGDAWVPAFVMNGAENVKVPEFAEGEAYAEDMAYNLPKVDVSNDGNNITIVETDLLKAYDNGHENGEWFGFILDLGVNPANISSDEYGIAEVDYKDAHRFGATSDTAFVMWLTEEDFANGNLEFTFKTGNEEITITLVFDGIKGAEYVSSGNVEVATEGVTYDTERSMFIVPLEVNEFTFTDNGTEKTASENEGEWTYVSTFGFVSATKVNSNKVDGITAFESFKDALKGNLDKVSVKAEDKVITVTKSEILSSFEKDGESKQWYALIVDFGIYPTLLGIDSNDITYARELGATSDTAFVIWLDGTVKTQEIEFKHIDNENVKDVITVNVEAGYETLSLNDVKKLDFTQITDVEENYANIVYNDERIEVTKTDANTVTVTELKPLKNYVNGSTLNEEWYGFIIDLGINPEDISTDGSYTIEEIDYKDAARWGASDTAFVMWLKGSNIDTDRIITFINENDPSFDSLEVTFKFVAAEPIATNRVELEDFLADTDLETVYLGADISDLDSRIVVSRPVIIEGQGHTLSFTDAVNSAADGYRHGLAISNVEDEVVVNNLNVVMSAINDVWEGVYGIQAYNSTNVTLNNIKATGADGGLMSNASILNLTGKIDLTGNEFGGIEVSVGKYLAEDAISTLNAINAEFVNETEAFEVPTIWTDGTKGVLTVNVADGVFTTNAFIKENQVQYYLDATNIEDAVISADLKDVYYTNADLEKPAEITENGSATLKGYTNLSDVRFRIVNVVKPEGANVKVWAKDSTGAIWDMIENGWGPATGFAVHAGYDVTTNFQIVADTVGTYSADIELYSVGSEEVVATYKIEFKVEEPIASSTSALQSMLDDDSVKTITISENLADSDEALIIDRNVEIVGNGNSISMPVNISGNNVVIKNLVFDEAVTVNGEETILDGVTLTSKTVMSRSTEKGDGFILKVNTGDFTLKNSKIDNTNTNGDLYNAIRIETSGVVVIEGNTFENIDDRIYNVIEFSQSQKVATGTTIKNNVFEGQSQNNVISMFNFDDGAVVNIEGNEFAFSGNALRISNYTNAKDIVINIKDNTYSDTIDGAYAGFMLFQEVENESFSGITVNVTNLIGPSGSQVTADSTGKDVFCYYYADHGVNNVLPSEDEATINFLTTEE